MDTNGRINAIDKSLSVLGQGLQSTFDDMEAIGECFRDMQEQINEGFITLRKELLSRLEQIRQRQMIVKTIEYDSAGRPARIFEEPAKIEEVVPDDCSCREEEDEVVTPPRAEQ